VQLRRSLGLVLRLLGRGLRNAPRLGAVPAAKVVEPIHAGGNVDVCTAALLARGQWSPQNAPVDRSICGGHDGPREAIIAPYCSVSHRRSWRVRVRPFVRPPFDPHVAAAGIWTDEKQRRPAIGHRVLGVEDQSATFRTAVALTAAFFSPLVVGVCVQAHPPPASIGASGAGKYGVRISGSDTRR
jgi:hypothetical protein